MLTQQKAKTSFPSIQPQLHKSTIVPEQEGKLRYWDLNITFQPTNVKASEATHANRKDGSLVPLLFVYHKS